jgi:hypothetical protein
MTEIWGQDSSAAPSIEVKVNGESAGTAQGTETLGALASRISSSRGLRTFSVYVNGAKMETTAGAKTLGELSARTVELVAKDARGTVEGWL